MKKNRENIFISLTILLFSFSIAMLIFIENVYAADPATNANCCDLEPVQGTQDGYWEGTCCYDCDNDPTFWDYWNNYVAIYGGKVGDYVNTTTLKICPHECCYSVAGTACALIPCETCGGGGEDPVVPCERCTLPSCPTPPLSSSGSESFVLKDYLSCQDTGSCNDWHYGDCYEVPSAQPSASLVIYPESVQTIYGFTSSSYTGAGVKTVEVDNSVNEPIHMTATYTDATSAEIEALYIWFTDTTMPVTPKYINLDNSPVQAPKTASNAQFGFLMHRESGSWKPYIPSILGSDSGDKWVWANYADKMFNIIGPDGKTLVKVEILSVQSAGTSIVLDFNIYFNGLQSKVKEGLYNVHLMANDIFGFTPYDNYDAYPAVKDKISNYWAPELIRFYNQWVDSSRDWSVDLTSPQAFNLEAVPEDRNKIKFSWELNDNLGIYGTVGNMFIELTNPEADLPLVDIFDNIVTSPVATSVVDPFTVGLESSYTGVIGSLNGPYLFKSISTATSGSVVLDINENNKGVLWFYITVFDNGGNVSTESVKFDLRDWMVTQGGIVYSLNGYDITTRMFTDDQDGIWTAKDLINRFRPTYADMTSELLAELLDAPPSAPAKADQNSSYLIRPFLPLDNEDYFSTLLSLFNEVRPTLSTCGINQYWGNFSGNLSANCDPSTVDVYFYTSWGDLTISPLYASPFVCDAKGVIFANGSDITFEGPVLNSNSNQDACIFVAQGDVYIKQGLTKSTSTSLGYDEINAYIFAGGKIYIEEDAARDGLYVSGGLYSRGGIEIRRSLLLGDRFYYPAVAVDHHSKYGVLGGLIFGSEVNMQKVEVGLKPY